MIVIPKFSPRRSGNGYVNTFDAHIPLSKLKEAGFVLEDGTVLEYVAKVRKKKIILEHKEEDKI